MTSVLGPTARPLVPQQLQILSHRSCIAHKPSAQQGTNPAVRVRKFSSRQIFGRTIIRSPSVQTA